MDKIWAKQMCRLYRANRDIICDRSGEMLAAKGDLVTGRIEGGEDAVTGYPIKVFWAAGDEWQTSWSLDDPHPPLEEEG